MAEEKNASWEQEDEAAEAAEIARARRRTFENAHKVVNHEPDYNKLSDAEDDDIDDVAWRPYD